jgi:hypothetical protein
MNPFAESGRMPVKLLRSDLASSISGRSGFSHAAPLQAGAPKTITSVTHCCAHRIGRLLGCDRLILFVNGFIVEQEPMGKGTALVAGFTSAQDEGGDGNQCRQTSERDEELQVLSHGGIIS